MTDKWVLLFIDVHVYILNLTFAGRNCLGNDGIHSSLGSVSSFHWLFLFIFVGSCFYINIVSVLATMGYIIFLMLWKCTRKVVKNNVCECYVMYLCTYSFLKKEIKIIFIVRYFSSFISKQIYISYHGCTAKCNKSRIHTCTCEKNTTTD